ncbi:hypothetical protein [Rhodococcus sp. YH3-3]|uniref:hypothetical protein n=1 Tax=Rhodococcus sp. YH3-3 TaxID=1803579 RepID=UPI0007DB1E83|nr:hypothetical protein [Rhodococcus sp. YH3-3]
MTILTFVIVLLIAVGIGLYSRIGAGKSTADFLVGGRSFGSVVVFIMLVGEVYSIGTIIGFPGHDASGHFPWVRSAAKCPSSFPTYQGTSSPPTRGHWS